MVLLKCLSKFWRTLEMPLIICEISLFNMVKNVFLVAGNAENQEPIFTISYKTWCSFVQCSAQDNVKILKKLESGFKRKNNLNKHHLM